MQLSALKKCLLPDMIRNGTINVDLLATLAPDAPDHARAFIGLAYRIRVDSAINDFCCMISGCGSHR